MNDPISTILKADEIFFSSFEGKKENGINLMFNMLLLSSYTSELYYGICGECDFIDSQWIKYSLSCKDILEVFNV